jgi:hypothetical protein
MTLIRLTSMLLLAPALAAQAVVSPRNFTSAEGNSSDAAPFGTTATPYRYLQVHADLTTPRNITALSLRRDGGSPTTAYPAYTIVVDLFMSSAATTASTMSATFDNNHGANKVQVGSFLQVSFPATSGGAIPRPFEYRIPLPQPYAYNGQGGLCWEARLIAHQGSSTAYHDMVGGSTTNSPMAVVNLGTGCRAAGRTSAVVFNGSSSMNWPQNSGTLNYSGTGAPNNAFGIIALGTNNQSYNGIPLPFEIPGTSGGSSGACRIYNSFAFLFPALADGSGGYTLNVGVPATQEFYGARLFGQSLFADAAANPVGAITSNQVEHNWVPPFNNNLPVGRVHLSGSTGATGTAQNRYGLIVQFE